MIWYPPSAADRPSQLAPPVEIRHSPQPQAGYYWQSREGTDTQWHGPFSTMEEAKEDFDEHHGR